MYYTKSACMVLCTRRAASRSGGGGRFGQLKNVGGAKSSEL